MCAQAGAEVTIKCASLGKINNILVAAILGLIYEDNLYEFNMLLFYTTQMIFKL